MRGGADNFGIAGMSTQTSFNATFSEVRGAAAELRELPVPLTSRRVFYGRAAWGRL
jgi:hypothetical protein